MYEKIILFVFGTCIGSFLNVCIYRLPKDKSIVFPPSSCPKCNKRIKWYDNIPVLSYIFLKAKCRNCKEPIPFRYPLVEFITGLIFLLLYLKFGISLVYAQFVFLFCLLVVVSFIDIDYHAIPAYMCVLGITVGIIFSFVSSLKVFESGVYDITAMPIYDAILGLLIGLGFTYLFKLFGDVFLSIFLYLRNKQSIEGETESLGLGDVDFVGMVGVFLGWKMAILCFFIAPFLAVAYSIFAIIFKKSHLIPYLPYLSGATLICFIWGPKILNFVF
ncbi:MAG: prepilin peptidase [Candidatus Omnitrophica bacterium]|nr:prepilin peptidase [Candidatus Omnitrophota bacterium]